MQNTLAHLQGLRAIWCQIELDPDIVDFLFTHQQELLRDLVSVPPKVDKVNWKREGF